MSPPQRDAPARVRCDTQRQSPLASSADRGGIAALRLTAQRLGTTYSASPADAVRWMLAVQAQELPGARSSDCAPLAARWPPLTRVRSAEDVVWLLSLTGLRQIGPAASRRNALGITDPDIGLADEAVRAALEGRRAQPGDQIDAGTWRPASSRDRSRRGAGGSADQA